MAGITRTVDYTLDPGEAEEIRAGLRRLGQEAGSPIDPEFYDWHWDSHVLLPAGLVRFLEDFRRNEPAAACLVHGFPVDDEIAGPTPAHWERRDGLESTRDSDLFMAMCGLSLGEPFAWATLQYGRMIQDVFPIRGDEQRLNGHGSDAFLVFHTDDAFHPASCDYLLLFGVRNQDGVPTYVSSAREASLGPRDRQILAENRFLIVPDDEHIRQLAARAPDHQALARAIEMRDRPRPVPILFGAPDNPYLRLDGPYTRYAGNDPAAERALAALHEELSRVRRAVVVEQGTLLVIDNHVAAHARESFAARYDGTDRWLRKIIVSRGLRKWADSKAQAGRRILC